MAITLAGKQREKGFISKKVGYYDTSIICQDTNSGSFILSMFFITVYLFLGCLYLLYYNPQFFGLEILNLVVRVCIILAMNLTRDVGTRSAILMIGLCVILIIRCLRVEAFQKTDNDENPNENLDLILSFVLVLSGLFGAIQISTDI